MCLCKFQKVNNSKGIIAYKVVSRLEKGKNFFRAMMTNVPYKIGMSYISLINRSIDLAGDNIIQEAIHLYTDLETARTVANWYSHYPKEGREGYISIIKCYIPKNALVFKGIDLAFNPSYATNMIRTLEVIEEHEII